MLMRLGMSKSKNSTSLYVIKSTYINSVHSTKIVETLGTISELEKKLIGEDPIEWAKKYIEELNKKEKEGKREILKCFRIMKTEFKARPVYLQRDDRIEAHFTTCFISLMIYRLLEKKLEEKFSLVMKSSPD